MYYCQHCGTPYPNDEAVICVKCYAPKRKGRNFCHGCGNRLDPGQTLCRMCGVDNTESAGANAKSKVTAGLLGIFLGAFGVHNFYLGYTGKAVTQLVLSIVGLLTSCLGIGVLIVLGIEIWGLVEGIMILTGRISTDGKGYPIEN